MEENLKVSEEYKKWFNRGYELQKSMPNVFDSLTIQGEGSEKAQAFEAGRNQYEMDKDREIEKEKDDALRSRLQARKRGRSRGRDR